MAMFNPFDSWLKLLGAASEVNRAATRTTETMAAAGAVVASRSAIIGEAFRTPLAADLGEMARMVPEKVEAFSMAGLALMQAAQAFQIGLIEEASHIGREAMRGRPLTPGGATALATRGAAYAIDAMTRGARAGTAVITPIHAKATANARRLRRRPVH